MGKALILDLTIDPIHTEQLRVDYIEAFTSDQAQEPITITRASVELLQSAGDEYISNNFETENHIDVVVCSLTGFYSWLPLARKWWTRYNVATFMGMGSNSFININLLGEEEPPVIILTGSVDAGNDETRNYTGYGNGLEFYASHTFDTGGAISSFSNARIGGIFHSLMTANPTWSIFKVRYLLRLFAEKLELNRETSLWDMQNGYGKLSPIWDFNVYSAYKGLIPLDPYYLPEVGSLTAIFNAENKQATIAWDSIPDANYYELFKGAARIYIGTDTSFVDDIQNDENEAVYTYKAHYSLYGSSMSTELSEEFTLNTSVGFEIGAIEAVNSNGTVTLVWDAVTGASTYRVYRGEELIYTGSELSFIDTVEPQLDDIEYSYIAYDSDGNATDYSDVFTISCPPFLIATLEEVKAILNITSTSNDALIKSLLQATDEYIKTQINNTYLDSSGNELTVPKGLKIVFAKFIDYFMRQYNSTAQSESIGDYSVSYVSNIPNYLNELLVPYRRVRFI